MRSRNVTLSTQTLDEKMKTLSEIRAGYYPNMYVWNVNRKTKVLDHLIYSEENVTTQFHIIPVVVLCTHSICSETPEVQLHTFVISALDGSEC
jgi:hypothetical protein